jgi:hypothetical protein
VVSSVTTPFSPLSTSDVHDAKRDSTIQVSWSRFRGQTELPLSLEFCGRFLKVPAPSGPRNFDPVGTWLNASAFQRLDLTANAGQFGTEGRNVNVGPGYADWDFAALKNFKVTESKQLQFRAELFDVLNRTNFRLPDSDISSPTFNHILAAEAPRQVQFALKFMF